MFQKLQKLLHYFDVEIDMLQIHIIYFDTKITTIHNQVVFATTKNIAGGWFFATNCLIGLDLNQNGTWGSFAILLKYIVMFKICSWLYKSIPFQPSTKIIKE